MKRQANQFRFALIWSYVVCASAGRVDAAKILDNFECFCDCDWIRRGNKSIALASGVSCKEQLNKKSETCCKVLNCAMSENRGRSLAVNDTQVGKQKKCYMSNSDMRHIGTKNKLNKIICTTTATSLRRWSKNTYKQTGFQHANIETRDNHLSVAECCTQRIELKAKRKCSFSVNGKRAHAKFIRVHVCCDYWCIVQLA